MPSAGQRGRWRSGWQINRQLARVLRGTLSCQACALPATAPEPEKPRISAVPRLLGGLVLIGVGAAIAPLPAVEGGRPERDSNAATYCLVRSACQTGMRSSALWTPDSSGS